MPPKTDPYATKGARVVDLLLILLAIVAIVIAVLTAPQQGAKARAEVMSAPSRMLATNATTAAP